MNEAIEKLQAEGEIRQLLARYADAIFRQDWDAVSACWSPDGIWHAFGQKTEGRDEILGWVTSLTSMFKFVWQTAANIVFEIDANDATARLYIEEVSCDKQDIRRFAMGIYHDHYKKIEGNWVFAERHWDLLYLNNADMPGKFWDLPSFGKPPHCEMNRPNRPTLAELEAELGL